MGLARIVLGISGLAFLAIGVPALFFPATIAGAAGIALSGALADNDFRAVYGGLECACGAALLAAAASPARLATGLALQQTLFAGLVGARLLSILAVGHPGTLGAAVLGAEAVGLAAGFAAHRRLRAAAGPGTDRPAEAA